MAAAWADNLLQHLRRVAGQASGPLPDGELLARFAAQRDEAAFAALMQRHGAMVLAVCRRVLGNWHDAEDVSQATFLVLARKAGSVRRQEAVGSWLYGVAYRLARKAKMEAARRRAYESRAPQRSAEDPLAELSVREAQAVVDAELARLPEKYRAPLVHCCLEGRTRDEAAQQLGWSVGLLKSRLEQGRERLRYRLCRRGLALPAALVATLLAEEAAPAALPASWAKMTVQAALAFSAGGRAPVVAARVAALAQGGLHGLFVTKLKVVTALLVVVGVVTGAGLAAYRAGVPKAAQARQEAGGKPAPRGVDQPGREEPKPARTDRYGDPLPPGAIARVGTLRLYHGSQFYALAYAPDGKALAACHDADVFLWDTATGKEIRRFTGPNNGITSVVFSLDGKALFSAGWCPWISVWDVASGNEVRRLPVPAQGTDSLALSPDGQLLAAATKEHRIHLWEAKTGREVRQLAGAGKEYCPGLAFLSRFAKVL